MAPRRRRNGVGPTSERERAAGAITPGALERAALAYLERYESSASNLHAVLERKIRRADQRLRWNPAGETVEPLPVADALADASAIVEKLVDLGYVDDHRFAEALVRQLRRRGCSHRAISQKLREKGVAPEISDTVLGEEGDCSELASASAFARRRGLGPFGRRDGEERKERRERDLAALARAGYDFEVARTVVDAPNSEALPQRANDSAFAS